MNRKIKIFVNVVIALVVVLLAGVLYQTRVEAQNLLTAPMVTRNFPSETPADYAMPFEEVEVTNGDGMKLVGWFIPSKNGAVIMMQHGYKATRSGLLNEAEMMYRHGYGILLTTVRAHDYSEGEDITLGVYEMSDMEAWYQYLISRDDINPNQIGILGNSYGGMLAIQYAAFT
jgi:uncharacterized protein